MASQAAEMTYQSPPAQKKGKTRLPPKRGAIKARIFRSIFRLCTPAASEISEEGVARNGNDFAIDDGVLGSSASTTAPTSSYTSATNSGNLIPDQ